jgi:hypothetical protein
MAFNTKPLYNNFADFDKKEAYIVEIRLNPKIITIDCWYSIFIYKEGVDKLMTDKDGLWKDCNCMNCRLARIEDNINKIMTKIDSPEDQSTENPGENRF